MTGDILFSSRCFRSHWYHASDELNLGRQASHCKPLPWNQSFHGSSEIRIARSPEKIETWVSQVLEEEHIPTLASSVGISKARSFANAAEKSANIWEI